MAARVQLGSMVRPELFRTVSLVIDVSFRRRPHSVRDILYSLGFPGCIALCRALRKELEIILHQRFGTPTGVAESGTEEEFRRVFKDYETERKRRLPITGSLKQSGRKPVTTRADRYPCSHYVGKLLLAIAPFIFPNNRCCIEFKRRLILIQTTSDSLSNNGAICRAAYQPKQ